MTRDEAIDVLKHNYPSACFTDLCEAVEMAIEALKAQDEEGDTINRQAAIDVLEREKTYSTAYKDGYTQTDYFKQYNMGLTDGIKAIKALPSAQEQAENAYAHGYTDAKMDYQPKQGKWLPDNRCGGGYWVCSVCKHPTEAFAAKQLYAFCPFCGAQMEGSKNESDRSGSHDENM